MNYLRTYNLCDENEYLSFMTKYKNHPSITSIDSNFYSYNYFKEYNLYYVAVWNGKYKIINHRLDGPALLADVFVNNSYRGKNDNKFYIYGDLFSEEDYWNHPDVLAYKYLQEHPELENFI